MTEKEKKKKEKEKERGGKLISTDLDINSFRTESTESPPRHPIHAQKRDILDMLASLAVPCWQNTRIRWRIIRIYGGCVHTIKELLGKNVF
jgi:hypothetical protein